MNEAQLFEFYAGGGDLAQLSDEDVTRLYQLIQQTQAATAPPQLGPVRPGETVPPPAPMNIGDIAEPREFLEWGGSSLAQLFGLGAGIAGPASIPARAGLTGLSGLLSGLINPEEGEGRLESGIDEGAFQAAMEGGGGAAAKFFPWAGTQTAVRMGVPPGVRSGGRTRSFVEAFLKERQRGGLSGWGRTPAVGQKTTALRKLTGQPSLRGELSQEMDQLKSALPERVTPLPAVKDVHLRNVQSPGQLRDPQKFRASTRPLEAAEALQESDDQFFQQHDWLQRGIQGLPRGPQPEGIFAPLEPLNIRKTLMPPPGTLSGGDIPMFRAGPEPQPKLNFGDLVEMAQGQGKQASPVFEKTAAGQWVRTGDAPEQLAARARKATLQQEAIRTAQDQGAPDVAATYQNLNERLSGAFKIEQAADKLRRGLAFAGIRGGLGAGLGSGVGLAAGGVGVGGPIGGALGLLATPGNISRAGSAAGRLGETVPSAARIFELIQQLENPPGTTPVRERKP